MKVLLTGVAGFIGSNVAEALLRRGDRVVGIDNFNGFYDPAIKENNCDAVAATGGEKFRLVRADIVHDPEILATIVEEERPDAICHLAAWAGVRPSIQEPLVYQRNNVAGTMLMLELARQFQIRPFVFASSSSVYGVREAGTFHEEDRVDDPISPYAASKKAGELFGYTYQHLFGLHFIGLRFFTVYGPRQRPEMAIHQFARRILQDEEINLHGDGQATRDFTYIDDCVAGVLAAIDRARTTAGYRIYNLGCGRATSLSELLTVLEQATGKKAKVRYLAEQPGDVPRTLADINRASQELGYAPKTPVAVGIPRFVEWCRRT